MLIGSVKSYFSFNENLLVTVSSWTVSQCSRRKQPNKTLSIGHSALFAMAAPCGAENFCYISCGLILIPLFLRSNYVGFDLLVSLEKLIKIHQND
jgi:hypothetical protein